MTDELDKIRKIKQSHESEWMRFNEVVAVGIGKTSNNKMGLLVSVKTNPEEVRKKIPQSLEDVPIEIQVTGEFKAL